MSSSIGKLGTIGASIASGGIGTFIPEPKTSSGVTFGGVLKGVVSAVSSAIPGAAGIDGGSLELINKQIEVQQQMQLVSLVSNVEKSKHETQMAAVRNIRAG